MNVANPPSTSRVARHSIQAILVPFPLAFTLALLTDIAIWQTADIMWENFSARLPLAGLIFGIVTAIAGAVDFLLRPDLRAPAGLALCDRQGDRPGVGRRQQPVHARDGWTAVVPYGLKNGALQPRLRPWLSPRTRFSNDSDRPSRHRRKKETIEMIRRFAAGALLAGTASLWLNAAAAHSIKVEPNEAVEASFDIVETTIVTKDDMAIFTSRVRGEAGAEKPAATGKFEGSDVYAYVWPTSLNSSEIGFDKDQGIVALAVTFHPDFDDAAKGGKNRDVWHPHWVVLAEDKACGGGLKVIDIPEGTKPKVPETWPGVPLLIDSPEFPTTFKGDAVDVTIPLSLIGGIAGASYDGVTAGLRVNGNLHAPLLCVNNVFKVASGDLSLPGKVTPAK